MKILVVGNGAREHAIAEAVKNSGGTLYVYMSRKNPGLSSISKEFVVDKIEPQKVAEYCMKKGISLAVVGPEDPLAGGLADELLKNNINCVGPIKSAARIEWDKGFARTLMAEEEIPGLPEYKIFSEGDEKDISKYIDKLEGQVAIKPAGLTAGKGVKVVGKQLKDGEEAKKYALEVLSQNIGSLGSVLVEEKLEGEEFTLQAFVDGTNLVPSPSVQDHKAAYENDEGPNTGGMGSYSTGEILPFMRESDYGDALEIMKRVVQAMKEDGIIYKGFLYGQFMLTKTGPKVIEFNSRLGDPEAMNILPIMKTNFIEVLESIVEGGIKKVEFENKATVVKYLVPEGYPERKTEDSKIEIQKEKISKDVRIYYASVYEKENAVYSAGSRSIGLLGIDGDINLAEKKVEESMQYVKGSLRHRKDIGTKELIQKRIDHMKQLRGE